jgi:hypothetical protein
MPTSLFEFPRIRFVGDSVNRSDSDPSSRLKLVHHRCARRSQMASSLVPSVEEKASLGKEELLLYVGGTE